MLVAVAILTYSSLVYFAEKEVPEGSNNTEHAHTFAPWLSLRRPGLLQLDGLGGRLGVGRVGGRPRDQPPLLRVDLHRVLLVEPHDHHHRGIRAQPQVSAGSVVCSGISIVKNY